MPIFDQNWVNATFSTKLLKMAFLWSKKPCFLYETASNYKTWHFKEKKNF